jgi:hypothetical protein
MICGLFWLAELTGLEPATSAVTGQRSNQLSYNSKPGKPKLEPITLAFNQKNARSPQTTPLQNAMMPNAATSAWPFVTPYTQDALSYATLLTLPS